MFGRLFRKSSLQLLDRGEHLLRLERYAEAREQFAAAQERLLSADTRSEEVAARIAYGLRVASDQLGEMNLAEAELSLRHGETDKANEHLRLVLALAEDVTIREKAENMLAQLVTDGSASEVEPVSGGCISCVHSAVKSSEIPPDNGADLDPDDHFQILIHSLPGDLSRRYSALGKEFAYAFLAAHNGDDEAALAAFAELLQHEESDILLYEAALVHHRMGNAEECEHLLLRSRLVDATNPIAALALVQLYIELNRLDEAENLLRSMLDGHLIVDQVLVMIGDVYQLRGDESAAVAQYASALDHAGAARLAAERLVPLLEGMGRVEEATAVAKRYLQGCC